MKYTFFTYLIKRDFIYSVLLYISFLVNYLFFISPFTYDLFVLLLVSQLAICSFFISKLSSKGFARFLLFAVVLFPKKNIGDETANFFLLQRMNLLDDVIWVYFDNIMLPILAVSWVMIKFIKGQSITFYTSIIVVFVLGLLFLNAIYPVQLTFWEYLPSLNILLFVTILLNYKDFWNSKGFFIKSIFVLIIIFYIEILLSFLGIIPAHLSYDYREGFRSIFIGFAVQVGFWSMLASFFSFYYLLDRGKIIYFILFLLSMGIQFLSFDRGNLFLSILFALILGFKYRYKMMVLTIFILTIFSPYLLSAVRQSKIYQIKSSIDESDILGRNSAGDRFLIQADYLKAIINNYGLPSGIGTNKIRYNKSRNYCTYYSDIDIHQASHSLFVDSFFEYGFLIILICFYLFVQQFAKMRLDFIGILIGIFLCLFWSFQSSPHYLFFLPLILSIWSVGPLQYNAKNAIRYKK